MDMHIDLHPNRIFSDIHASGCPDVRMYAQRQQREMLTLSDVPGCHAAVKVQFPTGDQKISSI